MPRKIPERPVGLDLARTLVTCTLTGEENLMEDALQEADADEMRSALACLAGLFSGSLMSSSLVAGGADPLGVWRHRIVAIDTEIGW